ncbi:MAG: N-6 DNA methylase [Rhodobacteraceae bacterium]|nr:N-6 DNA methylase [Paracoccaceae bacterium]
MIEILSSFHLSSVNDDIKGMAFEHFIHSYTRGAKNDLGQYFTPRHIVRLIVQLINPQVGETIYDPFCGTGGMLIECFRYLNQRISDQNDKMFLKSKTLYGTDFSDVARIAMMNMIMFGDGHSNIKRGDSFGLLGETRQKFDIVITNIPFSQETEFYAGYPVMPSTSKNGNSIAVQHCLESLKADETARAAIIVPIGFLYKPDLINERKYIFNKWNLERVVELSPKCFQPYTETQTAILFIRRSSKVTSSYIYNAVKNDGFSQDGYRIPIPGENDLDKVIDGQVDVEYPNDNNTKATI